MALAGEPDGTGALVRLAYWPVLCGPPPPDDPHRDDEPVVTVRPFGGLTVEGDNCTAQSLEALRGAARASQTLPAWDHLELRWLRPGWR
jgi:hypothetical protein